MNIPYEVCKDLHIRGRVNHRNAFTFLRAVAARVDENFTEVPRGFLKGLVDILDKLRDSEPSLAGEILTAGIDPDGIEAIEREETHLIDGL